MNTIRLIPNDGVPYTEIQVRHENGETRWLAVEAWAERWICVRWPTAGQYEIMLKDGRMISRSAKVRQRNGNLPNPWSAADYLECREWVREKLGISKEESDRRYETHHSTMPGVVAPYSTGQGACLASAAQDSARGKRTG